MGRLKQSTEKIQELLDKVESGEVAPDWNASEGEAGYIKGRSHYIDGAHAIPFEQWDKRFDEDGNAIYFQTLPPDNYSGCLIREGGWQEENYVFFGTKWKSLSPAVTADIRINYDYDSGDSLLEIKLYRESDSESFLATFINNALFAYGQGEDFIYPIANEFIPNTIARTNDVEELREETTALWENLDHGTFPDLVAGDLAGRGESVPAEFGFRASGGKSIKDGRAYIKRIKGNSVVWNNMVDTRGYDGGFFVDVPPPIIQGHKYLLKRTHATNGLYLIPIINGEEKYEMSIQNGVYAAILESPHTGDTSRVYSESYSGACVISDLTKMFGAGNEPTTIEDFQSRVATLGIDMYAYNEGQVIHCNTESIKSIGDNAWDEQWEEGALDHSNGAESISSTRIRSKNFCRIIGGEEYYLVGNNYNILLYDENYQWLDYWGAIGEPRKVSIDSRARWFKVSFDANYGTTYKNDALISLYHSGWKAQKDDQYQPYWQDTLPLPIINKYFPDGMKKAGTAHDEIRYNKASGKWEYSKGKIKSVDLGTLNWYHDASLGGFYSDTLVGAKKLFEGICAKYPFVGDYRNVTDKTCGYVYELCVLVKDSSYTDAASFKAAMQGVILYYESKDWEWVELDAEDKNFRDYYNVADFGTEMSQSNNVPSAAFSADIIYQFNAVDMIREHEIEINELQDAIKAMQAQLTSLINGGQ